MSDTITIVASYGPCLAKTVHMDNRVEGYAAARTFNLYPAQISNLSGLRGLLVDLAKYPTCAIVRGEIADPQRTIRVRRLLHDDSQTGDKASLRAVHRWWLALDLDSLPCPADIQTSDLVACARFARAGLPPELRNARCIAQATGSHGVKPGIRMRLWFWLDRPVSEPELRRWFEGVPCDHAVFGAAQLIYTAAPIFIGRCDPLQCRLVELPGSETVAVPSAATLAPTRRRKLAPLPTFATTAEARDYGFAALIRAVQLIGAAAEGNRHRTVMTACCRLAHLIHAGMLSEVHARSAVQRAAEEIGVDDTVEIDSILDWAFAQSVKSPFGTIENDQ